MKSGGEKQSQTGKQIQEGEINRSNNIQILRYWTFDTRHNAPRCRMVINYSSQFSFLHVVMLFSRISIKNTHTYILIYMTYSFKTCKRFEIYNNVSIYENVKYQVDKQSITLPVECIVARRP